MFLEFRFRIPKYIFYGHLITVASLSSLHCTSVSYLSWSSDLQSPSESCRNVSQMIQMLLLSFPPQWPRNYEIDKRSPTPSTQRMSISNTDCCTSCLHTIYGTITSKCLVTRCRTDRKSCAYGDPGQYQTSSRTTQHLIRIQLKVQMQVFRQAFYTSDTLVRQLGAGRLYAQCLLLRLWTKHESLRAVFIEPYQDMVDPRE